MFASVMFVVHSTSTQASITIAGMNTTTASMPLWLILVLTAAAAMGALIGGVLYFYCHRRHTAQPPVADTERDAEFSLLDRNLLYRNQATPNPHTEPPPPYNEWEQEPKFVSHHKSLPYQKKAVPNLTF
jgi:hypothetical protein